MEKKEINEENRQVTGKALWIDTDDPNNGIFDIFKPWFENENIKKV
jgi:hypothetical protein